MTAVAGVCPLCNRDRIPNRPPVCDACRSDLVRIPADIRDYAERLAADPDLVPDERMITAPLNSPRSPRPEWVERQHAQARADRKRRGVTAETLRAQLAAEGIVSPAPTPRRPRAGADRDEVASLMPSTAAVARLPFDADRVDLLAGARLGSRALHVRGILGLDPDQRGHLSLRTALEPWVRAWARHRGESLPPSRTGPMLGWLRQRIDWACNTLPVDELADFRDELRGYRSTMRALLGEAEMIDRKTGVSCPACHGWTLFRANGSQWIECAECPALMSEEEFGNYAGWRAGVCGGCVARIEAHVPVAAMI